MLSRCQSVRWSGKGISNGRHRLILAPSCRNLSTASLYSSRSSLRPAAQPRSAQYTLLSQQSRSLSLWPFGSPSTPSSTNTTTPSNDAFSVRASHATSDAPDPNVLSSLTNPVPMSTHEPAALANFEDKITLPPNFDSSAFESFTEPERIGYLKEVCGLDFGWGPSSMMEFFFEHFHIYSGLSWTTSIIAVTFISRLALIKFTFDAQRTGARMKEIGPVLTPLRAKYSQAASSGDRAGAMRYAQEIRAVSKDANIGFFPLLKPLLFQVPLSFGCFRVLRSMAILPVPAFESETFLWISNIALTDPIFMPILCSALTFLTMRKSLTSNPNPNMNPTLRNLMQFGLPIVTLVISGWQSAAVQIFLLVQTLFSFIQTHLLALDGFRALVRIPPNRPILPKGSEEDQYAGLNTRQRTIDAKARDVSTPTSELKPAAPPQDVSVIDRAVDSVKQGYTSTKDQILGPVEERKQKSISKRKKAEEEKHEYKRRQDIEAEREYRNQNARDEEERRTRRVERDWDEVGTTGMKTKGRGRS